MKVKLLTGWNKPSPMGMKLGPMTGGGFVAGRTHFEVSNPSKKTTEYLTRKGHPFRVETITTDLVTTAIVNRGIRLGTVLVGRFEH